LLLVQFMYSCFASFGPVRVQHIKTYPGLASDGAASASRTRSPISRRGASRRHSVSRGNFGRMRLELKPKRRKTELSAPELRVEDKFIAWQIRLAIRNAFRGCSEESAASFSVLSFR